MRPVRVHVRCPCPAFPYTPAKVLKSLVGKKKMFGNVPFYSRQSACVTVLRGHTVAGHALGRHEQGMLEPLKGMKKGRRGGQ